MRAIVAAMGFAGALCAGTAHAVDVRVKVAEGVREYCMANMLADPSRINAMASIGATAGQLCDCVSENMAASMPDSLLRQIAAGANRTEALGEMLASWARQCVVIVAR